MERAAELFLISLGGIFLLGGLIFCLVSALEREPRAAIRGMLLAIGAASLPLGSALLPGAWQLGAAGIFLLLLILGGVLLFIPGKLPEDEDSVPQTRVDEREIMFARARLEPGTSRFESYYRDHPRQREIDNKARKNPGLLSPDAKHMDRLHSAGASASFFLTEALRDAVDGPTGEELEKGSPPAFSQMVKKLARYYGALDCGICKMDPGFVYSHIGRGSGVYGSPIQLDHQFGIAFTVEMDFLMTGTGPQAPITMESGRQYVESARVAVQLAAAIRQLGYPARAHIDGNYRVVAPLVARQAGLGEIGRMGLLMTPRQGPRVRIGVVTTDLPLDPDPPQPDPSMIAFCQLCQKCAQNCPSRSISFEDRQRSGGVLRWQINPETCYHYWTVVGTDCGRCLAVCPYSHPDNPLHNLVRWGIQRSAAFRRAALILDDTLYGKTPSPKKPTFLT